MVWEGEATSPPAVTSVTSWLVTPQGPHPPNGVPEDPDGGFQESAGETDPVAGGADDGRSKGWVPPEDRFWRHPSEIPFVAPGPDAAYAATASAGAGRATARRSRHPLLTAAVATSAVGAVLAGVLLMMNAGRSSPSDLSLAGSTTTADLAVRANAAPARVQQVFPSLVALQVTTPHGVEAGCAVAVGPDGMVVTTADAIAGASAVTAMSAGGRRAAATVIGLDEDSDIALLRVPMNLPVAHFADDGQLAAGHPAMVLALTAGAKGTDAPGTAWSYGTIASVGTAVTGGPAIGMAGVDATAPAGPALAGDVLTQPDGSVVGIFDETGAGSKTSGVEVFLPADLLRGVSSALASGSAIHHGWLDVDGINAPTAISSTRRTTTRVKGAEIKSVSAGGPSAKLLQPGDVIEAVDGLPVRSMAELRTRLYVLTVGSPVDLQVDRRGTVENVVVDLAASP